MEDNTKEKVLKAAAKIFGQKGYSGARVDAIAKESGFNKAVLYYHIGGKDKIYVEVLKNTFQLVASLIKEETSKFDDPRDKLRGVVRTLHRFKQENPDFPSIMLHEVASGGENITPEVMVEVLHILNEFKNIIDQGKEAGIFRNVNPLMAYFMVLGHSLILHKSRPAFEKAFKEGLLNGFDLPVFEFEETSKIASDMFLKGLEV